MDIKQLELRHPEYLANKDRWQKVWDFFTGQCVYPERIRNYVPRKELSEGEDAYKERLKRTKYTNDVSKIINSLVGAVMMNEDDNNYVTQDDEGNGLGDRNDPNSLAYRLDRDADGKGNGRRSIANRDMLHLALFDRAWAMVDTKVIDPLQAKKLGIYGAISPLSIVNWRGEPGQEEEVLMLEIKDGRATMFDENAQEESYLHMYKTGYTRYAVNAKKQVRIVEEGPWNFIDRNKVPVLPIRRFDTELVIKVGEIITHQAEKLLQAESDVDSMLSNSSHPILLLAADDNLYGAISAQLGKGAKALQMDPDKSNQHAFISPPAEAADIKLKRIEMMRKELHETAFQQFGDAAKEKTATAIQAETDAGLGAYINLARSILANMENFRLDLIGQVEYGNEGPIAERNLFKAYINYSDKYVSPDPNQTVELLAKQYFGADKPLPLGRSAQILAAKETARILGTNVDEQEIEQAVDVLNAERIIELYNTAGMTIPTEIQLELNKKFASSLGLELSTDAINELEAEAESARAGREALRQRLMDGQNQDGATIPPDGQDTTQTQDPSSNDPNANQ